MRKFFLEIVSPKARATFLLGVLTCLIIVGISSIAFLSADEVEANRDFLFTSQANAQVASPIDNNYGLNSGFTSVGIQTDTDIKSIIASIINIAFGFLGILAVILILYAGYLWMTAGGNADQIEKAKKILQGAVIGLVIILSSWAIAAFIINQLRGATGSGGSGSGSPGGGVLPPGTPRAFIVDSFTTSHGPATLPAITGPNNNVYLCSSVQAQFNHWLDDTVFTSLKGVFPDYLTIMRNNGAIGDSPPSFVTEGVIKVELRNNVISFKKEDGSGNRDDWIDTSNYEVRIATSTKDVLGRILDACPDCASMRDDDDDGNPDYWYWSFTTGVDTDIQKPTLDVSYPGTGDSGVSRSTIFTLEFSEAIDVASVITGTSELNVANIGLQKWDDDNGIYMATTTSSMFDVSLNESTILFGLNNNHIADYDGRAGLLELYTQYKIYIQDIEDLCGNKLEVPVSFTFETGADVPGISFVRPSDGYAYSCPATPVFVQFNTSMYNVRTQSCGVDETGSAGLVLGGDLYQTSAGPTGVGLRNFPEDDYSGTGNPNDFCKQYYFDLDLVSAVDDLIPNTDYTASVNYIEPGGIVASPNNEAWAFDIAEPEFCAIEPYITRISPDKGPWEQCATLQGRDFGDTREDGEVYLRLALDDPLNAIPESDPMRTYWDTTLTDKGVPLGITNDQWRDKNVVAIVKNLTETEAYLNQLPSNATTTLEMFVKKTIIAKDGSTVPVKSNRKKFYVFRDQAPYQGACLYSITPSSGTWGDKVTIAGSNLLFNPLQDSITFYDGINSVARGLMENGVNWTSNKIEDIIVPDSSNESPSDGPEVFVTVSGTTSNALDFDIAGRAGDPCSTSDAFGFTDTYGYTFNSCNQPNDSLCGTGLECSPTTCLCKEPDKFEIDSAMPSNMCAESCPNAVVGFITSKPIKLPVAGGLAGKVSIFECVSSECLNPSQITPTSVATTTPERVVIDIAPIKKNQWYAIAVDESLESLTDSVETLYDGEYSWKFHTRTEECRVYKVDVKPKSASIVGGYNQNFTIIPYTNPDSCSITGQKLDPGSLTGTFDWQGFQRTESGTPSTECFPGTLQPVLSFVPNNVASTVATFNLETGEDVLAWACIKYTEASNDVIGGSMIKLIPPCKSDFDCNKIGVEGKVGKNAMKFDGVDDYINVGSDASINNSTASSTISVWAKLDVYLGSEDTNYPIFSNEDYQVSGYIFRIEDRAHPAGAAPTSGKIQFRTSQNGTHTSVLAPPSSFPNDKDWHHVLVRKDVANAEIFVDGVSVQSISYMDNSINTTNESFIGKDLAQYFDGSLDDLRIYNRSLTDEEIHFLANQTGDPISDLAAYWDFEANNIVRGFNTIKDISTNTNNGTPINMDTSSWCSASICDRNTTKCTPGINSFSPLNGENGTWVTINGCYFGNEWEKVYIGETSSAISSEADKPDPAWCGPTWTDSEIIASVGASTSNAGPVIVKRVDGEQDATLINFTPNSTEYPGMCAAVPSQGRRGSVVELRGQNFGIRGDFDDGDPDEYKFVFTDSTLVDIAIRDVVSASSFVTCPTSGLEDNHSCIRVVDIAVLGDASIKIIINSIDSNSINFKVVDTPPRSSGTKDMYVQSYTPGQTALACPNMLVEVNLEGELNLNLASIGVNLAEELSATAIDASNFFVEDSDGNRLAGIIGAESSASASKLQFLPKEPFEFGTEYTIVLGAGLETTSGGSIGSDNGDVCEDISATNELSNGGIEDVDVTLPDWSPSDTTITKDLVTYRFGGTASMKVIKNADDAYVQPSIAFTGNGSTYKITGYSFIPLNDGVTYTYIAIYDVTNGEVILKTDRAGVDRWQEHSFYLDTVDGDEYKVKLGIEGENGKFAYFDDISMKKVLPITTSCQISFNVVTPDKAPQCYVDHLSISPSLQVFSCTDEYNCKTDDDSVLAGNQELFSAELISKNNQPIISPRGLVGYWSFNDKYVSASTIQDQSGNGFDATIDPSATAGEEGKSGKAILFGGSMSDDRVTGEMNHEFEDGVTLSLWFKSSGGGESSPRMVEFSDPSVDPDFNTLLAFDTGGHLQAHVTCKADDIAYGEIDSDDTYILDNWHHAVYTYSSSDGAKLYVDSVKIKEESTTGGCDNIYGAERFSIGNSYPVLDNDFGGLIDEVRIYDRALSAYEVMNLYLIPGPSYTWETSDATIMSLVGTGEGAEDFYYYTAEPVNGSAIITSTVDGSSITGSTEARVFMCENPWPASMATDGVAFHDKSSDDRFTSQTPKTNFSTFYCRDRGDKNSTDDDLPMLPIGDTTVSKIGHCAGGTNNEELCDTDADCEDTTGDKHGRCIGLKEFGATTAGADRVVPGLIKETFFVQPWSKICKEGIEEKKGDICASNFDCDPAGTGKCVSPIDGGGIDVMSVRVLGVKWCEIGDQDLKFHNACVDDVDCDNIAGSCVVNPEYFSIRNWYNNQSDLKGSPASISVDRFDALQDGRSIYVNAPNHASSVIYNNIYLISINDKAHEDSINIYNQLVENWRFLVNVDIGEKEKLRRDLVRVNDAYYVADLINNKDFPVELESGTLQKGLSLSTWPSWNNTLGPRLGGTMPLDPKLNNIICKVSGATLDQTTCWDSSKTTGWQYQCDTDSDSQFYLYNFDEGTNTATFGFNLEYGDVADWNNVFVGDGWLDSAGLSCINKTYQRTFSPSP